MNESVLIRNPYFSIVLAMVITLCGVIGIFSLPVAQYPNITPPQVNVSITYPGADARTILDTVVEPIETQINGVPDMIYMTSTSSSAGVATIAVTFAVGTDSDEATRNVQDRVNWAQAQLPSAVQNEGIIVQEQSGNFLFVLALSSPNDDYDALFLSNYASINLVNELKRINGIAQIELFGGADYAMRVWMKPEKMASLGISPQEVVAALKAQNVQVTAGSIGGAPGVAGNRFCYVVTTQGRLDSVAEFRKIVVRAKRNGAQVQLSDVADVELAAQNYQSRGLLNGKPAAILVAFQRSKANALKIVDDCRAKMAELKRYFPPGMEYSFEYDSTEFIRESVHNVVQTLLVAVVLVALVCFLFLQNWRMALVPLLAMPVSIVGTFALLWVFGFSINLFTLFAMVLAIGIVVDDAIIVIENVHRLMTEEKLSPKDAAVKSMTQISGAIVATTAVLLAMFLPICFLRGITGELYRQFGVTISVAVLLSALNALTLSPVLSALLLRPGDGDVQTGFFGWFNRGFERVRRRYSKFSGAVIRRGVLGGLVYLVLVGLGVYLYMNMPSGFMPEEDQGVMFSDIQLQPQASLEETEAVASGISRDLRQVKGIGSMIVVSGFNILSMLPATNNALIVATLDPWRERLKSGASLNRIIMESEMVSMRTPEAFSMFFAPPPIPGIGAAGGFNLVLEQRGSTDPQELQGTMDRILGRAAMTPELSSVFSTFNADNPTLYLKVDRDKALKMGVSLEALNSTLESMLGFLYINDFNKFGQVYQVEIQAAARARSVAGQIDQLYVPNESGAMVPLSTLITMETRSAPSFLQRFNLFLATQIQGYPAAGYSNGQAMDKIAEIAEEEMNGNQQYGWSGMSYQAQDAGGQTLIVFALALVFIYLFLSALYGSWVLPVSALLAIPPALAGALGLLWSLALTNNVYTQLGMVLLFAMASKTAILVVDFAKQAHEQGEAPAAAAEQAAHLRFRAVLMTAFAFILGTIPLAVAVGPGAGSSRSIGTTVVGGMALGVVGVLILIPMFFVWCMRLIERKA